MSRICVNSATWWHFTKHLRCHTNTKTFFPTPYRSKPDSNALALNYGSTHARPIQSEFGLTMKTFLEIEISGYVTCSMPNVRTMHRSYISDGIPYIIWNFNLPWALYGLYDGTWSKTIFRFPSGLRDSTLIGNRWTFNTTDGVDQIGSEIGNFLIHYPRDYIYVLLNKNDKFVSENALKYTVSALW